MKWPINVHTEVVVYLSDKELIAYLGSARQIGQVLRNLNSGLVRVELYGTASQDSEGHNMWIDVHPMACRKLRRKSAKPAT